MSSTSGAAGTQRLIDVKQSLAQGKVVLWQEVDRLAKFTVPES